MPWRRSSRAISRRDDAVCSIVDGDPVAAGADGIPPFDRRRYQRHDASVVMSAFGLMLDRLERE